MTDPDLTPSEGDTPGPFATPAQDADVRALLGTLRAEDVPMPDDVVRRINAAVVAERVASTLPDSPAALVDADSDERATGRHAATVTVLPSAEERRGPSYRGFTKLLAVAAAVVVVAGVGGILVKNAGTFSGGAATSAGAGASQAPEAADSSGGTPVDVSKTAGTGVNYSAAQLATQTRSLVSGKVPAAAPESTRSPVATGATASPGTGTDGATPQPSRNPLMSLPVGSVLDRCVQLITTSATPPAPVAVDSGTYEGKPALVIVLPSEDDATSLDVFVVSPDCGQGSEPDLYEFQRVPR